MLAKYWRCFERNAPVDAVGRVCTAGTRLKRSVEGIPDPGDGVEIPNHVVRSQYARRCRRPTTPSRLTAPPFQIATRISRLTARSSRSTATEIQIMAIESRLTTIRSRVTTRNSPDNRPRPGFLATCAPVFAAANRRQDTEITCVLSQGEARIFSVFILERGGERGDRRGRLRPQPNLTCREWPSRPSRTGGNGRISGIQRLAEGCDCFAVPSISIARSSGSAVIRAFPLCEQPASSPSPRN